MTAHRISRPSIAATLALAEIDAAANAVNRLTKTPKVQAVQGTNWPLMVEIVNGVPVVKGTVEF
ncbi:MAG: hypothetical protein LCI02_08150 [Proteobacteria bacterium]|nr:hypothetical protein [Pseudomonadota bacterium]